MTDIVKTKPVPCEQCDSTEHTTTGHVDVTTNGQIDGGAPPKFRTNGQIDGGSAPASTNGQIDGGAPPKG